MSQQFVTAEIKLGLPSIVDHVQVLHDARRPREVGVTVKGFGVSIRESFTIQQAKLLVAGLQQAISRADSL